jgi:hypothetical protein
MPRPSSVELRVLWGNEVDVGLLLSLRNWSRVQRGLPLRIRGRGFRYDGEFFWDYWTFSGAPEHEVRVEYGEDGAIGFDGRMADV